MNAGLDFARDASYVIEHPKLPFVSYPYEWCFSALKSAALLHLDIHLSVLESDITLSDASAYNIQFQSGASPIFIDRLSFRRYREGEFWVGHRQFCEQFLNPLLLRALVGVPHNAWYRGNLERNHDRRAQSLAAALSQAVVECLDACRVAGRFPEGLDLSIATWTSRRRPS